MTDRPSESCVDCRFWEHNLPGSGGVAGHGRCHRYPPVRIDPVGGDDPFTQFPLTRSGIWCGEWESVDA